MSRLPLTDECDPASEYLNCNFFETTTNVTPSVVKRLTARDPMLSKVLQYTLSGWPNNTDPEFAPYRSRRLEITTEQGCLLWGSRVILPPSLRDDVLKELHVAHPGMTRMKSLARSFVWWPNLDNRIEDTVKLCDICQLMRNSPVKDEFSISPLDIPKCSLE